MKVNEIISEDIPKSKRDLIKKGIKWGIDKAKGKPSDKGWSPAAKDYRKKLKKSRADQVKASAKARKAAERSFAGLPEATQSVAKATGVAALFILYLSEINTFKEEYELYSTNRQESLYVDAADQKKAYEWYREDCDRALGRFVTEVGVLITPMAGAKLFGLLGKPYVLGLVPILGSTSRFMSSMLQFVNGKSLGLRAGLIVFLESPWGKEFFKNGIIASLFSGIGAVTRTFVDKANEALKNYTGDNVVTKAIDKTTGSDVKPPGGQTDQQRNTDALQAQGQAGIPYQLQTWKKGNVTYIGGVAVTDDKGQLLPGLNDRIEAADRLASAIGKKNPFDAIPKAPGVNYNR